MTRKKTPEEYYDECKEKGYDLPIENYRGSKIKIKHKCSKGHIYYQIPNDHLKGIGCKECGIISRSSKQKKTAREYIKECKERGVDLPIEDYINNHTRIKHKCSKGHIYYQIPKSHLKGFGCSKCSNKYSYTPREYFNICKREELDLPIEDYINNSTRIKHKCKYGHIYEQTPSSNLKGIGCPICSGLKKKTPEEYYSECKSKGYDLPIEDYRGNKVRIKHVCKKGHIYEQRPNNHLQGASCPICNESHGEKFIMNYLNKNNIKYESQKKFNSLKDKQPLSYDFYLPGYNILIEYQGIQHFESVSFNGKDYTDLDKQQHHDRLKQRFAKENGYRLLRPTYKTNTQEKINKYLDRYLLKTLDK